jgi:hypothetical protein
LGIVLQEKTSMTLKTLAAWVTIVTSGFGAGVITYEIAAPPPAPGTKASAALATSVPAAATTAPPSAASAAVAAPGQYVVLGWNDLGMHCISPRFAEMAILPPGNNLWAVVIRRGEEPHLTTKSVSVSYALDSTTVEGKTDFWDYSRKLFGKKLAVGKGLTGNGLSGKMKVVGDHFEATAIPALPYNDDLTWNPYQHATLTLYDTKAKTTVMTASVIVPVSDELNCQKCHDTGGPAAQTISTPTVEGNILTLHDLRQSTKLMANRPVLCSSCHGDPALKKAGKKGVESLSQAMHTKHATLSDQPACADCHPGAKTQCNRSTIAGMGPELGNPNCEKCHGTLSDMAVGLQAGRKPWVQEPGCVDCHAQYSTGTTLYRNARGHGGVPCAACHNSPHAWYTSLRADDNAQPLALQGNSKAVGFNSCNVCHTDGRHGTMPPHGGEGGDD